MTPAAQRNKALKDKATSEKRFKRLLARYIHEVVTGYRLGARTIEPDAVPVLKDILKQGYVSTAKDVTGLDIREYKQDFAFEVNYQEEAYRKVSTELTSFFGLRIANISPEIVKTSTKWIQRVSELAIQEGWTQRQADAALTNYLKSQRLVVAMTEAQVSVEATRRVTVKAVKDPLKNSVEQVATLIEQGKINEARALSKQVEKLNRIALAQGQGSIINEVSGAVRPRLLTPLNQGRAVANLRARAEELDSELKGWQPIGDSNTRVSHSAAGAQYLQNPIPVDQPFVVAGQLMQYPGDGSLGASLSEIINCRCATIYF